MELKLSDFSGMRGKDVVGLWYGYKKIISVGLTPDALKTLAKVFRAHGFVCEALDERFDYKKRDRTYLVAKDAASLRAAAAAYKARRFDVVGAMLGYPKCCVAEHFRNIAAEGPLNDFVRKAAAGTGKFHWQLNNLLDFDGRLCGKLAAKVDISGLPHSSLISHNPCSYDCRASLRIARLNQALLRREMTRPSSENDAAALKRPVLYADDFNFALLNGASAPGGASYRGTACVLGFGALRQELESADQAAVSGRTLTLSRKGRAILRKVFPKPPLILPFDR